MGRYACFPDVFYVICSYDHDGIDFETIDATINEEVAQEQVMALSFEYAYEWCMRQLHRDDVTAAVAKQIAYSNYKTVLATTPYFYKKVDLRKEM